MSKKSRAAKRHLAQALPVVVKAKQSKESKNGYTIGDQFTWGSYNQQRGRPNPSKVTFQQLRNLSLANNLVRNCINRIKHTVIKVDWSVAPKDTKVDPEVYQEEIDYVTKLLNYPNPQDSNRDLLSKIVEDILVIDQGVLEKVRNMRGELINLYPVDGATIRPNIDEYGLLAKPAYYQYLEQTATGVEPDAEFDEQDLVIFQINPQVQNGRVGYGLSPVEAIIQTVVTTLQASIYNESLFNSKQLPPFIANLPKVSKEDLMNFKFQFMKSVEEDIWTTAFVNTENLDIKPLRPSNQDMQFAQLNEWLAKIIFSAFELSGQNFGMTMDINRATSESQERLEQGAHNVIDEVQDRINRCVVAELAQTNSRFDEVEFKFDSVNKQDEKAKADIAQIYLTNGVVSPNEVRHDMGLEPIAGGDTYTTKPAAGTNPLGDLYNFGTNTTKSITKQKWLDWY